MYVLVYVLMFVLLSSGNEKVKMSDVIHFFSGASKLPTSGFPAPPKICFTDEPGYPGHPHVTSASRSLGSWVISVRRNSKQK